MLTLLSRVFSDFFRGPERAALPPGRRRSPRGQRRPPASTGGSATPIPHRRPASGRGRPKGGGGTAGGQEEEGDQGGEDHPRQHVRQPAPAEQPRRAGEGLAQPQAVEPVQPCRPGQQEDIGTGQNRERMTRAAMTPSTTMRNTIPGPMGSFWEGGAGTKGANRGTSLPWPSSPTSSSR